MRAVYLLLYRPWRPHRVCPDRPHGRCAQNSSVPVRNLTCSFLAFVMLSIIIYRASKPQVATNHESVYAISLPVSRRQNFYLLLYKIYNNMHYTTLTRNLSMFENCHAKNSCQRHLYRKTTWMQKLDSGGRGFFGDKKEEETKTIE